MFVCVYIYIHNSLFCIIIPLSRCVSFGGGGVYIGLPYSIQLSP